MIGLRRLFKIGRLDNITVEEIEDIQQKLVRHGFPILITGMMDDRTSTIINNLKTIHNDPKNTNVVDLSTDGTYPSQRIQLIGAYDKFQHYNRLVRHIILYDIFKEYRHIFNVK